MKSEEALRKYTTKEILWYLEKHRNEFDTIALVTLCDELLQRNESIRHLKIRYENLVKRLSNKEIRSIELNDEHYAPATLKVVDHIMRNRKLDLVQWFYSEDGNNTVGPVSRIKLIDLWNTGTIKNSYLVWKEGTSDWKVISKIDHFKKNEFFDQIFDVEPEPVKTQQKPSIESSLAEPTTNGNSVVSGVLELVSLPFWIAAIVYSIIASWDTELGFIIPLFFCIFAAISVIPIGVGLFLKKKWAWSMKLFVACGAIFLIVLKTMFSESTFLWMLFGAYQGLIMLLILSGKDAYVN